MNDWNPDDWEPEPPEPLAVLCILLAGALVLALVALSQRL